MCYFSSAFQMIRKIFVNNSQHTKLFIIKVYPLSRKKFILSQIFLLYFPWIKWSIQEHNFFLIGFCKCTLLFMIRNVYLILKIHNYVLVANVFEEFISNLSPTISRVGLSALFLCSFLQWIVFSSIQCKNIL